MPLYEYGCPKCGHSTDVRHGFDERPELQCEQCGTPLQRRFSAAPIVFKGSGFYVTDSRNSKGKSEKSESAATDKPASDKAASDKPASESKAEPAKSDTPKKSDTAAA
ncbi:MAG: zinc ribbon domain-containing protein [Candidatus Eremiobacteraeota bacterium]|nr:zinc ribbon domain-containing protein [Candidatus Eremiobacteraeota bacterium]